MAVEENFLEHVPLHCLSSTTIQNLGVLLDPSALESDIRRLADVLGYDYAFIINLEDRGDKTKYFFETWWCLRPDFTVLKLKECLEIMEREDIMTDVWPQIENDARIWNRQNQEKPPPVNPRIESENDARVWNKQNQENPPPVNPRTESDDSWKLTIHDVDQTKPAQYNACLCYEEEDFEVANTFVRELEQISSDLKFFIPHHHVMPGKYLYDCVAQVIEERCNKKVVIILPRTEFKDATCDFALQYARALDPFGVIVPVIRDSTVEVPSILQGIAAIRFHLRVHPRMFERTAEILMSSSTSHRRKPNRSNPLSSSLSTSDSICVDKRKYSRLKRLKERLSKLIFQSSDSRISNAVKMRSTDSNSCSIEESPNSHQNKECRYISNGKLGDRESFKQRSMSLNDIEVSNGAIAMSYSDKKTKADVHINVDFSKSSMEEDDTAKFESTNTISDNSIIKDDRSVSNHTNLESNKLLSIREKLRADDKNMA